MGRFRLECLPGFVAPLDFLVAVAWKKPTTELGLRRITTKLPSVLEQCPKYRNELLDRVLRTALTHGGVATGTIAFYSNLNLPINNNVERKSRGLFDASSSFSFLSFDTAVKVVVVSFICHGVAVALMDARRNRK